jgi:hypothetical protein
VDALVDAFTRTFRRLVATPEAERRSAPSAGSARLAAVDAVVPLDEFWSSSRPRSPRRRRLDRVGVRPAFVGELGAALGIDFRLPSCRGWSKAASRRAAAGPDLATRSAAE